MKKLFCFLFTLLLLITLQSTAFAQDQAEVSTEKIDTSAWVTYKIKELGMSIKLPPDMKVYTRESIKKGNVEEDENFDAICEDFSISPLFLKAKNETSNFTISINNFISVSSFAWPNLFFSDDITIDKLISFYNSYSTRRNYSKFESPYGKFIASTNFKIEDNKPRVFSHYESRVNYQNTIVSFSTYQKEVPSQTQYIYDEIVLSIQFNSYRFNFIFLATISIIAVIFFAVYKLILKIKTRRKR